MELAKQLPLESEVFFAMVKQAGLFPLDAGEYVNTKPTRATKVNYFIQHVLESAADLYLPKLLKVMKDSEVVNVVGLANKIQAALEPGMYALTNKYTKGNNSKRNMYIASRHLANLS